MDTIFSWTFSSSFERTKHWYIVASTIIISAVIVSFLVGEYLLGVVLIIFAGVYMLYDINTHPEVRFVIGSQGISLNEDIYDYTRVLSFGVIKVDNKPLILRFKTNIRTIGSVDIFLDPALSLSDIRAYLQTHLHEDSETDMGAIDRILL
jgi:hypothetical protein